MSRNARLALIPGLALIALATLALSGCGQKGPLYMPGDSDSSRTYDPQGAFEADQDPTSAPQTPAQRDNATQGGNAAAPQASPMPTATQPDAEELP